MDRFRFIKYVQQQQQLTLYNNYFLRHWPNESAHAAHDLMRCNALVSPYECICHPPLDRSDAYATIRPEPTRNTSSTSQPASTAMPNRKCIYVTTQPRLCEFTNTHTHTQMCNRNARRSRAAATNSVRVRHAALSVCVYGSFWPAPSTTIVNTHTHDLTNRAHTCQIVTRRRRRRTES